jgi:hypothetical protein
MTAKKKKKFNCRQLLKQSLFDTTNKEVWEIRIMEFEWKSLFNEIIIDIWLAFFPPCTGLSRLASVLPVQSERTASEPNEKEPPGLLLRWGSYLLGM